jgi:hypothetical protein
MEGVKRARNVILLAAAAATLAGCAPSQTANYTPGSIPVASARTYPFEVEWKSSRRGVDPEQVRVFVMIDDRLHPMSRVASVANRWEARIPVADGREVVPYRFKFEYPYPGLGTVHHNSEWSPEYRLVVSGRP